jgi:hypothetical protein
MVNLTPTWNTLPTYQLRKSISSMMQNEKELNNRLRQAKYEYWEIYKTTQSEVTKREELERISIKYNIDEKVILDFVDTQKKFNIN